MILQVMVGPVPIVLRTLMDDKCEPEELNFAVQHDDAV
jgi:hypothetical protein